MVRSRGPSGSLLIALSDLPGTNLDREPLYRSIDLEALDHLFTRKEENMGMVRFTTDRYLVRVHADGTGHIYDRQEIRYSG